MRLFLTDEELAVINNASLCEMEASAAFVERLLHAFDNLVMKWRWPAILLRCKSEAEINQTLADVWEQCAADSLDCVARTRTLSGAVAEGKSDVDIH
jgi:hypothetical protein